MLLCSSSIVTVTCPIEGVFTACAGTAVKTAAEVATTAAAETAASAFLNVLFIFLFSFQI
ncbi:MAG TPA: hypothetical protein DC019_02635 [Ruminococcus sp.]|nr:hypothetical protein [Ruminococcus sp.]